jgi:Spy/CpxP family protein refolding chaperone
MRLTWVYRLFPVLLVVATAAPVQGQSFGFPWWKDAQFQRDLTLSADQSARIETIFRSSISALRHQKRDLDQQEADLSTLIATNADEGVVIQQVDKVETIRASMNKTRTLMLLHERQVLTPDQRIRLSRLHEQWEKDHRRRPSGDVK